MPEPNEQIPILSPIDVHHPVIDATGLEGGWDVSFTFHPPVLRPIHWAPVGPEPNRTTILQGVEKLGLKLEGHKRSYPVMVIDHIEQRPTEN